MTTWNSHRATWIAVLIGTLLATLAGLQYRWLGELSSFEHRRMQVNLRAATDRFAEDIDREIDEIYYIFHVRRGRDSREEIAEEYEDWATSFPFPELIDSAFWVTRAEDNDLSIQAIALAEGRFNDADWPPHLEPLRAELLERLSSYGEHHERSLLSFEHPLRSDIPALVVFQYDQRTPTWAIVVLRREVLVEQFLRSRVREYYGSGEDLVYDIWIVDRSGGDRVIYSSNPAATADLTTPDIERSIFGFDYADDRGDRESGEQHWTVVVKHQAGSLEAAVSALRRRNLAVSFGIVLLVGASVLLIIVATRRAQRLAEQQMEFVAGVSHELRTPLAGISSLSQNLRDGVVRDVEQSREYGKAIYGESRRLGQMVEKVLQFSALRSGKQRYELRIVDLQEIIRGALEGADVGPEIETAIEAEMPPILGDTRALTSAIQNLLSNAIKFSEEGGSIRIVARAVGTGETDDTATGASGGEESVGEIQISIEDQGRGIPASEQPHIFKPFYRGRTARAAQVEGSGLGLSLVREVVEAHGGRITVSSSEGVGTVFTLHLPAADPGTVAEAGRGGSSGGGESRDSAGE